MPLLATDAARPQFDAALHSLRRLRESRLAETGLVYAVGVAVIWRQVVSLDVDPWYRTGDAGACWCGRLGMWAWFFIPSLVAAKLVPMAPLALTVLTDVELASMLLGLLFQTTRRSAR